MKLIYYSENDLSPIGGPAGYLFGLSQGLSQIAATDVHFLPPRAASYEKSGFLQRIIPNRIKEVRRLKNALELPKKKIDIDETALSHDLIHFHETKTMYLCRESLEDYKGSVVLTSHSPCVYHKELIARLNPRDAIKHDDRLKGLEEIDKYAFERADYIVFPCPEAEEPYFHSWSNYSKFRNEEKLRYLPTGIVPAKAKMSRKQVREKYGIPNDAFVISFLGRHNEIKGYDDLVTYGQKLIEQNDKIWFLNAGREGKIVPPKSNRWIEIGWTNDPHSIMAAADAVVIPNKETYFDLAVLEALSLGTPIIASRTGGNRYFERMGCEGVVLYDDQEGFTEAVAKLISMSHDEKLALSSKNKLFFEQHHETSVFATNYIDMTDSLLAF